MIAIVNVSKNAPAFGIQDYEVRINHEVVTTFQHKREEGLAKCLLLASAAVEKNKWTEVYNALCNSDRAKNSRDGDGDGGHQDRGDHHNQAGKARRRVKKVP